MSIENEIHGSKARSNFNVLFVLALCLFAAGMVLSKQKNELQRKYDVLIEVAIAKHDGQVAMEAMMNAKASDDANEIREAIEIVYDGKKPENKE